MLRSNLRPRAAIVAGLVLSIAGTAGILTAHDFWLVPSGLTAGPGASLEVLGQSGSRFPTSGGATQPAQVVEARIISGASDEKVTDLSVSGKSLMLRHRPRSAGQYVVGVKLAARSARTTPARLQRYIALEGAPELAARYETEGAYPVMDSVTQESAKFAKTIVQYGARGARAFNKPVGHPLEMVPLDDPSSARVGQSVRVRLLLDGKPLPNVHVRAGWGDPALVNAEPPAAGTAPATPDQVILTDAEGVAKIAITDAGLWNVRTLYAYGMRGMPAHWLVYFSTMVFSVDAGDPASPR